MIDRVRIRGFRAHADTQLELGRFTVLVGDNASGKTSVLDALRVLGTITYPVPEVPPVPDGMEPTDLFARGQKPLILFDAEGTSQGIHWQSHSQIDELAPPLKSILPLIWGMHVEVTIGQTIAKRTLRWGSAGPVGPLTAEGGGDLPNTLGTVGAYNLRFEQIAAAAHSDEANVRVAYDGTDTAVVLAAMKLNDDQNFDRIMTATRRLIPTVERIRLGRSSLPNRPGTIGNKIIFDFQGAPNVPAHAASHGTLIVLALLTILYSPNRPSLVLLDDLDHALHPRAQMELMKLLQELLAQPEFQDVQIVATTHSPYVLDMIDPANIYAFAMRPDGTSASKRLSEHPDAAKTKGMLAAGQLWSLDAERKWVLRDAS